MIISDTFYMRQSNEIMPLLAARQVQKLMRKVEKRQPASDLAPKKPL